MSASYPYLSFARERDLNYGTVLTLIDKLEFIISSMTLRGTYYYYDCYRAWCAEASAEIGVFSANVLLRVFEAEYARRGERVTLPAWRQ